MSNSGFGLGRNDMVNTSVPEKTNHRASIVLKHAHKTSIAHAHKEVPSKYTSAIMHEEEESLWYSF